MQLYDLMTNKMEGPVIEAKTRPSFSWRMENSRPGTIQHSYRIRVSAACGLLWDSGEVISRDQAYILYEGPELPAQTIFTWALSVTDSFGETASAEAAFETASPVWQAVWVESTIPRVSASEYKYGSSCAAVRFSKTFTLPENVLSARIYATACGVYQLQVNGIRPDDREFAPEFTVYGKVHYYQTYDATALLHAGKNELAMTVGDGWYFSSQASPVQKQPAEHPAILFQLEALLADGSRRIVCSDGTETCAVGPILYSDLFQGEKQDLRLDYEDRHPAAACGLSRAALVAQPMPPVRPMRLLAAWDVFTTPKGETIVDFGQVLAGRARIRIDLPRGAEAIFEYFEILDANGNYINTMFAPQKDTVISAGKPVTYEAAFTFHGFRYIRVTGIDEVRREDFTAVLLTTEKENAGFFECSDPRLGRLYENIRWSQRNNMMSVPTDCPSREKAGWTGDILIYAKTALQNENVTPFLTAWLANVRADQGEDGAVMITTPFEQLYADLMVRAVAEFGNDRPTGVAGWSDCIVWVPYDMYRVTGNRQVLRDNYNAMDAWCRYILRTAEEKRGRLPIPEEWDRHLWNTGFHFGEWLIPSQPSQGFEICKSSSFYVVPFFGYATIRRMAEIAALLEKDADAARYEKEAEAMKEAIQRGLMDGGYMPADLMGAYVLAFAFDLVPQRHWEDYVGRLVRLIEANHGCLDTGFLATPFILDALEIIGRGELAHSLLWQNAMPSWLYEVEHGATAIWEAWNADEAKRTGRFVSFDHYAFGCVDDWILRRICGIDTDTPGYRHVIIDPQPDGHITHLRRRFLSEAGWIEVCYDEKELTVTVPCNAQATVRWRGQTHEIGSGTYRF